jgi:predicted DCC family thiol-disulfide oxidoreductase YuxK
MGGSPVSEVSLIYDGLCLFCIRSLRVVRALDLRQKLDFHDANDRAGVLARYPALADVDLDAAMYAVDSRGRVYQGFYAFRRIAWTSPLEWWLVPLLYFPGVSFVGARVYALIASNRTRLGCRIEDGGAGGA